jgi:D-arabinose 5-phosphate isomerase GutQ
LIDRAALLLEDIDASAEALERLARAHEDGVLVAGAAASTQPAAGVAPLLAEAAAPSTRLVFVGLGSSWYAADVVAAELRSRGREAVVELAARDAPTRMRGDELMFAISSSGRTAEVVDIAMTGGPRAIG